MPSSTPLWTPPNPPLQYPSAPPTSAFGTGPIAVQRPIPPDPSSSFETRVPRRVALFTETFLPRVDGIVNTLCWMLRGLVEAGLAPLVVAPNRNTAAVPRTPGIRASAPPPSPLPRVRPSLLRPRVLPPAAALHAHTHP